MSPGGRSHGARTLAIGLAVVVVGVVIARLVSVDASSTSAPAATTTAAPTTAAATDAPTTEAPTTAAITAPPTTEAPTTTLPLGEGCSATGSSASIDRDAQQAWLCEDGRIVKQFPITSAITLPDPGTYQVYAKDMNASSTFGGHFSRMTHFVAFTYGKYTGARVAFHSVPTFTNGDYVQPLDSVGDLRRRGESSGCIRVLPDDAVLIWDTLDIGDQVTVLN